MLSSRFQKKEINYPILLHIGIWLLYLAYIYILNYIGNPEINVLQIVAYLLPLCLTFYVSLYCFKLFSKLGIILSSIILLLSMLLLLTAGYCYIYTILPRIGITLYKSNNILLYIQAAFAGYLQYFIYALLYFMIRTSFRRERSIRHLQEERFLLESEKKKKKMEVMALKQQELLDKQEKLKLEYGLLRAQINPHFLHNTLNVLFSQALVHSPELPDNIMKLSKLMRYALESFESESGQVEIEKELQYLQTLIEIHQIRFGGALQVNLTINGEPEGHMLPPLCIITIVENAFKYGDVKDPAQPLTITLNLLRDHLYFCCYNKKKITPPLEVSSYNIGLKNISKRLDLLFNNRYNIHADNRTDSYRVELIIKR